MLPEQLDGLQIKLGAQKQFIDDQDNIYMTMPEFETASETYKMLIRRVNATGEEAWSNIYEIPEANGNVIPTAIKMDKDGNLLIIGTYVVATPINYHSFLIKINSLGEVMWLKSFAGSTNGFNGWLDFDTDDIGNIYLAGATTSQGLTPDFTVMAVNTDGQQLWLKQLDQTGQIDLAAKIEHLNGVVFATGITQQDANTYGLLNASYAATDGETLFETPIIANNNELHAVEKLIGDIENDAMFVVGTITKTTGSDFYVAKVNMLTGLIIWQSQNPTSGLGDAQARSAAKDNLGNVFVTGYMKAQNTGRDFAVVKYNPVGLKLWTKFYDGTGLNDEAYDIAIDDANHIYLAGYGIEQPDNKDFLTIKTDNDGNELWRKYYNGIHNGKDIAETIKLDNTGGIVVGGPTDEGELIRHTMVKYGEKCTVELPQTAPFSSAIAFIENRGQLLDTDGDEVREIRFKSDRVSPTHYFFDDKISLVQVSDDGDDTTPMEGHRVDMFFNASINRDRRIFPLEKRSDYYNYYLGHIPEGRARVPLYKNLVHTNAFPNIDVQYAGKTSGMSYSFIVKPTGNPSDISLGFNGQNGLSVNGYGELVIGTSLGDIVLPEARAYQMNANGEAVYFSWTPAYEVLGGAVGFDVGGYDLSKDLVIEVQNDPEDMCEADNFGIEYSTYYGGSNLDIAYDITLGQPTFGKPNELHTTGTKNATTGEIYITGLTSSADFPVDIGGLNEELQGSVDAFVISMSNLERLWVTHFGGQTKFDGSNCITRSVSIAYDINNSFVYFTGSTDCVDFPISQADDNPANDYIGSSISNGTVTKAYITKLNEFGLKEHASYFGGTTGIASGLKLDINNEGNLYMGGHSSSKPDLVSNNGNFYQDSNDDGGAFIAEFDSQSQLIWSTRFSGTDAVIRGLTIDNENDLIITGDVPTVSASSTDFVNQSGINDYFETSPEGGEQEAFIAKFDISSNSRNLIWSTLYAGNGTDYGFEVEVNSKNNIYLVGATRSTETTFPLLNEIDGSSEGGEMYIAQFTPSGILEFASFYGGSSEDVFQGGTNNFFGKNSNNMDMTFDSDDNLYITAGTGSNDFSLQEANGTYFQEGLGNDNSPDKGDGFICVFDKDFQKKWITYFGGRSDDPNAIFNNEEGFGLVVLGKRLYLVGETSSDCPRRLPVKDAPTANYFSDALQGSRDASITVFTIDNLVPTEDKKVNEISSLFKVYPSPASTSFTIEIDNSINEFYEISLYNILGQVIWNNKSHVHSNNFLVIPTNDLPSGTYFVSLTIENQIFSKKIIIQH